MQKKVLALHDLSGFGRSSLVPIISVLSAFGHQCVPLPTAVFSTHMAIPGWVKSDLTGEMHPTIDQYDRLGLRFEAVYAGFLGSASQIDSVREAAERLKAENGLTLIDPVMGDNGEVYSSYNARNVHADARALRDRGPHHPEYHRGGDPARPRPGVRAAVRARGGGVDARAL